MAARASGSLPVTRVTRIARGGSLAATAGAGGHRLLRRMVVVGDAAFTANPRRYPRSGTEWRCLLTRDGSAREHEYFHHRPQYPDGTRVMRSLRKLPAICVQARFPQARVCPGFGLARAECRSLFTALARVTRSSRGGLKRQSPRRRNPLYEAPARDRSRRLLAPIRRGYGAPARRAVASQVPAIDAPP